MKQALVIVSFGTTVPEAQRSISAVEEMLALTMPKSDIYTALTSPTIRGILSKRGQEVFSLEQILETIVPLHYERVIVQPTHFIHGFEYDRIKACVDANQDRFQNVILGKPLLSDCEDLKVLAQSLKAQYSQGEEALVLMGHGTEHPANMVYPAFQTVLRMEGFERAYVGTVEGWPAIDDVISQLTAAGEKNVLLVPMMLVAGDHACNDMAGAKPDSWKSRLEAAGIHARCHMEGLGMLPEIQQLYCRHLKQTAQL